MRRKMSFVLKTQISKLSQALLVEMVSGVLGDADMKLWSISSKRLTVAATSQSPGNLGWVSLHWGENREIS